MRSGEGTDPLPSIGTPELLFLLFKFVVISVILVIFVMSRRP